MEEDLKILKKEKRKKIWPIICIVLVILLLAGGGYYYYTNYYNKDNTEETTRPSLKDDFYAYANYKNTTFDALKGMDVDNQLAGVIDEIEKDPTFKDENYFAFINLYEDQEERDKRGLEELKSYFEEIDNADTLDKFSDIMVKVSYDLGVYSFINFGIQADYYNTSKNVIAFGPMVLEDYDFYEMTPMAMTTSGLEFFTNDKYDSYKNIFEKGRISYFTQYGYDEEKATKLSNDITDFAKTIQAKSASIDDFRGNYLDYYKNLTKTELKSLIHNLPIDKLLAKYNLSNYTNFAIYDEGHIKALDDYYKKENLPLMKEILKLLILERVASLYTTSDYARIFATISSSISGGRLNYQEALFNYEKVLLKPLLLGSTLNIKYDEKYFPEEDKKELIDLINKIKEQYKEIINDADWLEDSTKTTALKKVDNMKAKVGYTKKDTKEIEYSFVNKENGGSLISNYISMNQTASKNVSTAIKEKITTEIYQFMYNAMYDPQDNSVNILSGYREEYRGIEDKYELYGNIGYTIAHEMSHGFDNAGSRYDENGNVKEWWTEEDKNDYMTISEKIVKYYSNYEMYGMKINGQKTLGENIADLGAVKVILKVMESENATNDDYKKFFEAYAKSWNDLSLKSDIETTILMDTHSPNKIRANAVLSSVDKFYEVYDIKEGDKMYVAKEDRVGLW